MVMSKNQIYIFEDSSDQYYQLEEVVLYADRRNLNKHIEIKTFERLEIQENRTFNCLVNIIESKFKKLVFHL